jgi:hypothetical protein
MIKDQDNGLEWMEGRKIELQAWSEGDSILKVIIIIIIAIAGIIFGRNMCTDTLLCHSLFIITNHYNDIILWCWHERARMGDAGNHTSRKMVCAPFFFTRFL